MLGLLTTCSKCCVFSARRRAGNAPRNLKQFEAAWQELKPQTTGALDKVSKRARSGPLVASTETLAQRADSARIWPPASRAVRARGSKMASGPSRPALWLLESYPALPPHVRPTYVQASHLKSPTDTLDGTRNSRPVRTRPVTAGNRHTQGAQCSSGRHARELGGQAWGNPW